MILQDSWFTAGSWLCLYGQGLALRDSSLWHPCGGDVCS